MNSHAETPPRAQRSSGWTSGNAGRRRWIIAIALLVIVVGAWFAMPSLKRHYRTWSEARQLRSAQGEFDKGNHERAILGARAILETNPANPEALRLFAKSLEATHSQAALNFRIRIAALLPGDVENQLALARDAIAIGDAAMAERALAALSSQGANDAGRFEVQARLAMLKGNRAEAESLWRKACELSPGNVAWQIQLSSLELESTAPDVRSKAEVRLRDFANDASHGIDALRILFENAQKYAHPARIREAADALAASTGATLSDRISRLEILRKFNSADSASALEELCAQCSSNPEQTYELLVWMTRNDLATYATSWITRLPAEIKTTPPVQLGTAQTYVKAGLWAELREFTERGGLWAELDYLRRAFLARALERLGEPESAAEEWKQAVSAAQSREDAVTRLERLARAAQGWQWTQREEDLLWRMMRTGRAPRWALDSLWKTASARAHTAQLHEIAGFITKARPGDPTARNYYNFLCLITRTQEGNPHTESRILHEKFPDNPAITLTYAISLYQNGDISGALALTSSLSPEHLRQTEGPYPFYHAVFLIAMDRGPEADEFLKITGTRTLLPEEKAILDRERAAAKQRAEQAREQAAKSANPSRP